MTTFGQESPKKYIFMIPKGKLNFPRQEHLLKLGVKR